MAQVLSLPHLGAIRLPRLDLELRQRLIVAIAGLFIAGEWLSGFHALLIAAAVIAGADIAARAVRSLAHRTVTIELLVTVAAIGALVIGEYWEAAAVTFLFVLGAWLEARTMQRTRASLAGLLQLAPATANVLIDGDIVARALDEVAVGDHILVRAGESIPIDGVVLGGSALVREAVITGESMPVAKSVGSSVYTGTIALDAALTIRAEQIGADSLLGRIVERVEEAQDAKAPVQTIIERFAIWYTPAIIALAVTIWLISRDTHLALTILVIGCPGALVIATPVAFIAAIGRAASFGILVKGGEHLEQISRATTIAFDKTGTITSGMPTLTDTLPMADVSERDLLTTAAIAEQGSAHPLAGPILEAARGIDIPIADAYRAITGYGVVAQQDDREIVVGTSALMNRKGVEVPTTAERVVRTLEQDGKTVVLVARSGELLGILAVQDQLRPGIAAVMRQLGNVAMLTGDNPQTAAAIAATAGIDDVHAQMLPDDKLAWVRAAQSRGQVVAMVGDGVNDAPALAAADISIAMGAAGSDVALETASIALINDDPARIVDAMRISRRTRNAIRQNLVIVIGTVAALLAGVLLKEVSMAGGMFVHEASVMIVMLNGMRLMRA